MEDNFARIGLQGAKFARGKQPEYQKYAIPKQEYASAKFYVRPAAHSILLLVRIPQLAMTRIITSQKSRTIAVLPG